MAQPPDISETFLREVDENLRRDRVRDFAKAYGSWLIAAVVLFLGASGGFIWWQQHQLNRSEAQVEQLSELDQKIGAGNVASAPQQLDELAKSGSKAVRATALLTRAAVAIQQNDVKLAVAKYREIVADDSLPKPYRDAALIRQTALEFDQIAPQEVVSRMDPLTKPGAPWFGVAGEMTALALIKQGKNQEAGRLFLAISKDKNVSEPVKDRSVQIAGSLGVDVSAVEAPQAQ